ncbi:lipoyl synthase, partial [archaeon]|nr:lipoyl synthase [archaeon]
TCTRACAFCDVKTGLPGKLDQLEPVKIAEAVKKLNLKHVVITSVDRDDLDDGGSSIFAKTIDEIHEVSSASVEVLTPDYTGGNLKRIIDSKPEVYGHNIETVRRVFKDVRSKGDYDKSLSILLQAKKLNPKQKTKTALMVGLGETSDEIIETMKDLRKHEVDFLAIGQYLRPTKKHVELVKYYTPQEFVEFARIGKELGFLHVEAGPLVRSSYRADKINKFLSLNKLKIIN